MSINQIDKSVNELEKMSNGTSFVDLKEGITDILSTLANSLIVNKIFYTIKIIT